MKRIARLLATLLLVSCVKDAPPATRQAAGASAASLDVKWSNSSLNGVGIQISLGDSIVNDQFVGADNDGSGHNPVDQMTKLWNASNASLKFFQVPAPVVANRAYATIREYENDGQQGIYKSVNWFAEVDSRALAVTQYRGIRRNYGTSSEYIELTHADIIMNYRDYNFTTDENSVIAYDFHTVIIHELGHFIGLGHTRSTDDSVMRSSLSIFDADRTPSALDKQNLANNYGTAALAPGRSSFIAASVTAGPSQKKLPPSAIEDDQGVHGLIELRADGSCHHYVNGKLIESH